MRFFRGSTPSDDDTRINNCYNNIKLKISNECGIADFIEKDGWIAFSGSFEKVELLLTISLMKSGGTLYLYADIDDEVSWQEWDFDNQEDFENAIVEYIVPLVNRTIKTVTKKKKHKYIKVSRYYLENNEWILIDENVDDNFLIRLFITKDSTEEEIRSYHLT